jgi:hypothetical protein
MEIQQYWKDMKADVDQTLQQYYDELHYWRWRRERGRWIIEPR